MNSVLLILALTSEVAALIALKLSQGFSKPLSVLVLVVFAVLSLALLPFAFPIRGVAVSMMYAA